MTDKQKYFRLLSLVCETLPTSAINDLVRAGHPSTPIALTQVRNGRSTNLAALTELVKVGMPGFAIPEDLLPAEPASY